MNWRPVFAESALRQLGGIPDEAMEALIATMRRVCEDPYDAVFSLPIADDPTERWAELGEAGFIAFVVRDSAQIVEVTDFVWAG